MKKQPKLKVEETETDKVKAKREKKEKKQAEIYANSMISRKEAFNIANSVSQKVTQEAFETIGSPLAAAVIEIMAIGQLLTEKGILTEGEITERIQKIAATNLDAVETGDAKHGEEKEEDQLKD